jgi:hypothetical protein
MRVLIIWCAQILQVNWRLRVILKTSLYARTASVLSNISPMKTKAGNSPLFSQTFYPICDFAANAPSVVPITATEF